MPISSQNRLYCDGSFLFTSRKIRNCSSAPGAPRFVCFENLLRYSPRASSCDFFILRPFGSQLEVIHAEVELARMFIACFRKSAAVDAAANAAHFSKPIVCDSQT